MDMLRLFIAVDTPAVKQEMALLIDDMARGHGASGGSRRNSIARSGPRER